MSTKSPTVMVTGAHAITAKPASSPRVVSGITASGGAWSRGFANQDAQDQWIAANTIPPNPPRLGLGGSSTDTSIDTIERID